MLSLSKLEDGLIAAMEKAREVGPEDGDGKVEPKYNTSDIAGFYADAVVDYVKDAEIMMSGTPYVMPNPAFPPTQPPLIPDFSFVGQLIKIQTADVGKAALKSAFQGSFDAQDPAMAIVTSGLIAYTATLTFFQGSVPLFTGTGATVMALPPIFVPVIAGGLAGMEEVDCAKLMAAIIHASFKASLFNGAGTTVTLGFGGILAQALM